MKFFLYLVIKIIGITLFVLVCLFGGFFLFFVDVVEKDGVKICSSEKWICLVREKNEIHGIIIREDVKPWIMEISKKIVGKIYEGASVYNPQGDVVPDSIDDTLKIYIKDKVQ